MRADADDDRPIAQHDDDACVKQTTPTTSTRRSPRTQQQSGVLRPAASGGQEKTQFINHYLVAVITENYADGSVLKRAAERQASGRASAACVLGFSSPAGAPPRPPAGGDPLVAGAVHGGDVSIVPRRRLVQLREREHG